MANSCSSMEETVLICLTATLKALFIALRNRHNSALYADPMIAMVVSSYLETGAGAGLRYAKRGYYLAPRF